MNAVHAGDVVVLVSCCKSGPRYLRQTSRPGWRCGRCGSNGFDLTAVVLGPGGALPTPDTDLAARDTADALSGVGGI